MLAWFQFMFSHIEIFYFKSFTESIQETKLFCFRLLYPQYDFNFRPTLETQQKLSPTTFEAGFCEVSVFPGGFYEEATPSYVARDNRQ